MGLVIIIVFAKKKSFKKKLMGALYEGLLPILATSFDVVILRYF
jgi:hypothetical protein